MKHILIAGIGGVGGYIGGMLAKQFESDDSVKISFLCRGENLIQIQNQGIHLKTTEHDFITKPYKVTESAEELDPLDYVICCTKSYGLQNVLESLKNKIDRHTVFLPLLNGVDSSNQIMQIFPENPVWNGCIYIVSRLIAPGEILVSGIRPKILYGTENPNQAKIDEFNSILNIADIPAFFTTHIEKELWEKYFFISPVASLTSWLDQTIGEFRQHSSHVNTLLDLIAELKSVAQVLKIDVDHNIVQIVMDRVFFLPPETTSSMHSDFQKGNQTELESLTGHVIKLAYQFNLPVPTYQKIYEDLKKRLPAKSEFHE